MNCRVSYEEPEWVKKEADEMVKKWQNDKTGISLADYFLKNGSKEFLEEMEYARMVIEESRNRPLEEGCTDMKCL